MITRALRDRERRSARTHQPSSGNLGRAIANRVRTPTIADVTLREQMIASGSIIPKGDSK